VDSEGRKHVLDYLPKDQRDQVRSLLREAWKRSSTAHNRLQSRLPRSIINPTAVENFLRAGYAPWRVQTKNQRRTFHETDH